jgi:hypothetical protein
MYMQRHLPAFAILQIWRPFPTIDSLCQGRPFLLTFFARICRRLPAFADLFNPTITSLY